MTPTPSRPRRSTLALGRSRRLALSLVLFGLAMNELPAVSVGAFLTKSRLLPATNELKP